MTGGTPVYFDFSCQYHSSDTQYSFIYTYRRSHVILIVDIAVMWHDTKEVCTLVFVHYVEKETGVRRFKYCFWLLFHLRRYGVGATNCMCFLWLTTIQAFQRIKVTIDVPRT